MEQQWLIRSEKHHISGPYSREILQKMVLAGDLGLRDEICLSGDRWIFIQDQEELEKQLGVTPPKQVVQEEKTKEIDFSFSSSGKKFFKIFIFLVVFGVVFFIFYRK